LRLRCKHRIGRLPTAQGFNEFADPVLCHGG
jgi:hypothetical protein